MTAVADTEKSIARYEAFAKSDPHNPQLWLALGDLYHKVKRLDEALACFERADAESGGMPACKSRIASVHITRHNFADAEAVLRQLLRAEPGNSALLFNLALSLYYQRKWDDAFDTFSAALTQGLRSKETLAYLARTLHHQGKIREALEFCNQWVEQTNDAESGGYQALLEMDEGNMPRALELAQQVLARDPTNTDAAVVTGTHAFEEQEMADAERAFTDVLRREPDNGRAWLGLGLVRMYQQNHAEAITALEKAVEHMSDSSGTIVALGWACLANADQAGSERVFRKAIDVDRSFAEAHGGLASALALQARVRQAEEAIQIANRLDRHNFGAQFARMILLKIQGRAETAQRLLTNLLERSPAPDSKSLIEILRVYGAKQLKAAAPPNTKRPT